MRLSARVLSCVRLFEITWTVTCQAPLSVGFPRQEHWSGLPFPSLGALPDPGIEPASAALAGRAFTLIHLGSPQTTTLRFKDAK